MKHFMISTMAAAFMAGTASLAYAQSTSGSPSTSGGATSGQYSSGAGGSGQTGADRSSSQTGSGMSAGQSGASSTTGQGATGSTAGQPGTTSGASSTGGSMPRMDESQVKSLLQTQGYSDVSNVKRDGDRFELQAKKDGKVQRLEVDARTGSVKDSDTKRLTESSIEDRLKKEGYSDVSDVKRDGDKYQASAKKDGKNYKLEIDAKDGKVQDREES